MLKDPAPSYENTLVSPHAGLSVRYVMAQVIFALFPGIFLTAIIFGLAVLAQLMIAIITVGAAECLASHLRNEPPLEGLHDGAWLVLAFIVAISLPPYCPWFITVMAAACGSLIGKHIFGGTGQNLFNPAMVGIVFVLVCFPKLSTYWPTYNAASSISFREALGLIFAAGEKSVDVVSGATLLEFERTQISLAAMRSEFSDAALYGIFAERGWEWVNLAYLAGGLYLCWRRMIRVTIPLWFLAGLFAVSAFAYGFDSERFAGPLLHWFTGATMLCAFFIATDPVSSPTGKRASIAYALTLAALVFIFRTYGEYPDGVAFAVVLANVLVPIYDRILSPQIYGHK